MNNISQRQILGAILVAAVLGYGAYQWYRERQEFAAAEQALRREAQAIQDAGRAALAPQGKNVEGRDSGGTIDPSGDRGPQQATSGSRPTDASLKELSPITEPPTRLLPPAQKSPTENTPLGDLIIRRERGPAATGAKPDSTDAAKPSSVNKPAKTEPPKPTTGSASGSQSANGGKEDKEKDAPRVPGGGLAAHERVGGHTLARHVGKTEGDLRDRLERENVSAASTFYSEELAEASTAAALALRDKDIKAWLKGKDDRMEPINFSYTKTVGMTLRPGAKTAQEVRRIRIILVRDPRMSIGYHIITSYPIP